ncbi:hypothetical protein LX16_2706 [Stackebrandtia albiflava]|uniref:Uncharacterized protein n=1 Tax=Stackebrandtia albiflava TaxID=406432 RepID=A0A562V2A3_9ACTN|nr:hypothetical protein [Stackebrandtia albiflava]TWJ11963.1 hypothetical protein LX16_2706 [Stackebrandtia albiflava]
MSKRDKYRQMLRAGLVGDYDTAERYGAELGEVSWQDSGVLVNALFTLTVQDKFDDDADRDDIRAFVRQLLDDYSTADPPLKPLMAEGLIRSVLGEDELYREIDKVEAIPTQTAIAYKLVSDANLSTEQIDELLADASELADRWSN